MTEPLGTHIILDLHRCQSGMLAGPEAEAYITQAAIEAGATVLASRLHVFPNKAFTLFVMLAESHVAVHTYPEFQQVSADVYVCGVADASLIARKIDAFFMARECNRTVLQRGLE